MEALSKPYWWLYERWGEGFNTKPVLFIMADIALHMYITGIIIVIVLYLQESCIDSPAENSEVSEMAAGQESTQMAIQSGGNYDLNS